jgi:uncharacterized protein
MPAFVLPLKDIDEAGKHWSFTVGAAWLTSVLADTGLRPTADAVEKGTLGTIEVTAQRSGDDILLRGRLKTHVATDCARCLEDALVVVDSDLTTLLMPESQRPAIAPEDEGVTEDAVVRDYFSGDEIVLDPLIRELIVLEEPMQPLCSPDCAGIPSPDGVKPPADFGREEGVVDPRLAPLLKLKRDIAQTEE